MPDGGVIAVEPPLVRPDPPELDHEGRGAEEEDGERVGEDGGEGGQPRHVPGHGAECRHNKHRAISGDSSDVGYGGQGAEIRNCIAMFTRWTVSQYQYQHLTSLYT